MPGEIAPFGAARPVGQPAGAGVRVWGFAAISLLLHASAFAGVMLLALRALPPAPAEDGVAMVFEASAEGARPEDDRSGTATPPGEQPASVGAQAAEEPAARADAPAVRAEEPAVRADEPAVRAEEPAVRADEPAVTPSTAAAQAPPVDPSRTLAAEAPASEAPTAKTETADVPTTQTPRAETLTAQAPPRASAPSDTLPLKTSLVDPALPVPPPPPAVPPPAPRADLPAPRPPPSSVARSTPASHARPSTPATATQAAETAPPRSAGAPATQPWAMPPAATGSAEGTARSAADAMGPIDAGWRGALAAWLAAHRVYPEDARRAGEQGRAAVRFTIERTGQVLAVALARSSGSERLDEAAQAMLRGRSVPPLPAGMPQDRLTITVTILYALTR